MSGMAAAAIPVRTAILHELTGKEMRPIDLLSALASRGYAESDVKEALADLIREGRVELTPQRILKGPASQDAA
jgi:hypothetical protein